MDLYLSNCLKAAEAAASKVAASNVKADKDTCSTSKQKTLIPKVGASSLLDLPLGAKLPIIPGSTNIFYTTNISEKLYQPSFGFNLSDPYCQLMETTYKSLHDPHLKAYYKRKDILKKLKKGGYITDNNKVICSLRELNKYRHYLTTLKIDFERSYIREQKIIESQVNKINEEKRTSDSATAAEFQQWLLQEGKKPSESQERLIKRRHCQMIRKELDKIESTRERRNTLQMKEEDRQHWDSVRRRLNQHNEMGEEWKCKEMTLLTKISDEVKRESKVEEHRRKITEEINRKKQVMLQKRIAYHLQKLQITDDKGENPEGRIFENKRDDKTVHSTIPEKTSFIDQKMSSEHLEQKPSTSVQTSASDQKSSEEPQEVKSALQSTKKSSFAEQKPYEHLKVKFSQIHTRRSLPEEPTLQEPLEPKPHHGSVKKTSFGESTVLHESLESKRGPASKKRTSFVDPKFMQELLEAKYLYPNTKRSFSDQKMSEDHREQKVTLQHPKKTSFLDQKLFYEPQEQNLYAQNLGTSFDEEKSFEELMEAISPPQTINKPSFADQKLSQESLDSRQSIHRSHNNTMFFTKILTTFPPQQRDIQNTTEQQYENEPATTSYHSYGRGIKRVSVPVPSHPEKATEVSRQSLQNISKREK